MTTHARFSTHRRSEYLQQMVDAKLDVLVIGGGITGAGIALDAASRGLTVGLVEMADFAGGTSSRSTKLIHGGLRYLKQGEVNLVREVGQERAILYRNAPHVVIPERMLLPIVERGTYGRFATSAGLWVYDFLAKVAKEERRRMLGMEAALEAEPLLRSDILKGAGLYYEYRTDDARLTIEVLKTAVKCGALCCNYARVTDFVYHEPANPEASGSRNVIGAYVRDEKTGESHTIYARTVVNAAGPWVDDLREFDQSKHGKRLHLTKGVHIVVPYARLPLKQSVYFDVPDGRMVFAIPRDDITYVGTTDTDYHGSIREPRASEQDVRYLLQAVNAMFPTVSLTIDDVQSSWAGLRPLIHEDGKSASELSRKDEIFESPSGLLSMAGGKLTGYRKMAERLVDKVMVKLNQTDGRPFVPCKTAGIVLSGGDQSGRFQAGILQSVLRTSDADNQQAVKRLLSRYGSNADQVISRYSDESSRAVDDPYFDWLCAEMRYSVDEEMATSVSDFLLRRTGRVLFQRQEAHDWHQKLHEQLVQWLSLSEEDATRDLASFEREYAASRTFPGDAE